MTENTNLWVDVVRDLRQRIESGKYGVGTVLPTEMELCDIYGVSRFTVRAALKVLQDQGIVSRRRNVGTRVEAAEVPERFSASPTSFEELAQYGSEHPRQFVSVRHANASPALAALLGCGPHDAWIHLSFVRMSMDDPKQRHSWIDVYIRPEFEDVVEDVKANPRTLTSALMERRHNVHIAAIHQQISAMPCTAALAKQIGATAGDAALRIQRHYADDQGRVVMVSVSSFAADRYRHTTVLRRAESV